MTSPAWTALRGNDPILATAIHTGHELRDEAAALIALPDDVRLREEDPFTDSWIDVAENSIVVARSRFEVDLNRPRERAVYREPGDAWGLELWKTPPSEAFVEDSLALYDRFYAELADMCDEIVSSHGHIVVLDLHSYNHRRPGADEPVEDPDQNPEINLGTESIAPGMRGIVDIFADAMASHPFDHGHLDVRENVKFKGGQMTRWINDRYGDRGCSIALEVKKIYMDEWTGSLEEEITADVGEAIAIATEAVRTALGDRTRA